MKKKLYILLTIFAGTLMLSPFRAEAGINGSEASVIAAASGTFEYNGKYYVAAPGYVGQLTAQLDQPGINLTDSQAGKAIGSINGGVAAGVANGYLVEVGSAPGSEGQDDPTDSTDPNGENVDNGNDSDQTGSDKDKNSEKEKDSKKDKESDWDKEPDKQKEQDPDDPADNPNDSDGESAPDGGVNPSVDASGSDGEGTLSDEELAERARQIIVESTGKTYEELMAAADQTEESEDQKSEIAAETAEDSGQENPADTGNEEKILDESRDLSDVEVVEDQFHVEYLVIGLVVLMILCCAGVVLYRKWKR